MKNKKILEIDFKVGENVQIRLHGGKVLLGQINTINRSSGELNITFMDSGETRSRNFTQGKGCKITYIK